MRKPHLPQCPQATVDGMSIAAIRDYMTSRAPHAETAEALHQLLDDWHRDRNATTPVAAIRQVLDSIRALPRGDERTAAMNTVVRTLGTADSLATLLDMMRHSARRDDSLEQQLTAHSRLEPKHSLYGWCGQTKLISSSPDVTPGTLVAESGVQEIFGSVPVTTWCLTMHIWQPNPAARGFPSGKRPEPNVIVEPPHSHPHDFVSMVAIGSMYQSIYMERRTAGLAAGMCDDAGRGRYSEATLQHVTGVWPPHADQESAQISAQEERVLLSAGDSYYLPCNMVHDVEIDASTASTTPTITLFLRSEAVVKPHVYMAPSMVDFHAAHPSIADSGQPLLEADWHAKLELVSEYLRGARPELVLDHVVKQSSEYAFFHR